MLALLMSLMMTPATSQARSPMLVKHYAPIVKIVIHNHFPETAGTVTFMQGCADFSPVVQLSNVEKDVDGSEVYKLRVELSSYPAMSACLAMPTEQTLNFQIPAMGALPTRVIADTNFTVASGVLIAENLHRLHFQPGSALAKKDIQSAYVEVNLDDRKIILTLQPSFHCPKGLMCAQMMPAPIEIVLPLKDVKVGGCNETIYTASIDQRPVDGVLNQIKVIDNTKNYCESFAFMSPTVVQYLVEGGRPFFQELHSLEGDSALAPL